MSAVNLFIYSFSRSRVFFVTNHICLLLCCDCSFADAGADWSASAGLARWNS